MSPPVAVNIAVSPKQSTFIEEFTVKVGLGVTVTVIAAFDLQPFLSTMDAE